MTPRKVSSCCSSRTVIYAAVVGNLLIALTKFGAAAWTGSSAMLSEGIHSVVDTGNELLLLYGLRRAKVRPPSGAAIRAERPQSSRRGAPDFGRSSCSTQLHPSY